MSHLLTKSMQNLESADILINANMFSASVHCSYYSCLQLCKHVLISDMGMTFADIEKIANGSSSHKSIIKIVYDDLVFIKRKSYAARNLNRNINRLKISRIKADYGDELLEYHDSIYCLKLAKLIITLINTNYTI
ncbi:MAG: hypothetical protein ACOYOA_05170 [Saprospiraceae bacterium]